MDWIKVEDNLPRCSDNILFTDGKKVWAGWLETYDLLEDILFYSPMDRDSSWPDDITHWMPFPDAPGDGY